MTSAFAALVAQKSDDGFDIRIRDVERTALPPADTLVRITHSSLNYKDALAITNSGPVIRKWPMIVGIDGAGIVERCDSNRFKTGDIVVMNGWGAGETHWGCLSEYASLKSDWLLPLDKSFTSFDAMAIGTAGYTAMLCAIAIDEHGVKPGDGDILVTGASGGVGSFAISILSSWGYSVAASTGRLTEEPYLKQLGAKQVIDRASLSAPGKPLAKEQWVAAVDSVGSTTLANICAGTCYGGIVTACGLAQGMDFPATVAPFILRGVTLKGIDSVMAPLPVRARAWNRLAQSLDRNKLRAASREIKFSDAVEQAHALKRGEVRGRLVVNIEAGK